MGMILDGTWNSSAHTPTHSKESVYDLSHLSIFPLFDFRSSTPSTTCPAFVFHASFPASHKTHLVCICYTPLWDPLSARLSLCCHPASCLLLHLLLFMDLTFSVHDSLWLDTFLFSSLDSGHMFANFTNPIWHTGLFFSMRTEAELWDWFIFLGKPVIKPFVHYLGLSSQ